jgi:hypothetical protein
LGGGGQQQQEVGDSAGPSVATMHFTHQPRATGLSKTAQHTHTDLKLDPAVGRAPERDCTADIAVPHAIACAGMHAISQTKKHCSIPAPHLPFT